MTSSHLRDSPELVEPVPMDLHLFEVTKLQASLGIDWYLITSGYTKFIVIGSSDKNYPSTIWQPDGTIVNFLSKAARKISFNSDVFATVTLSNGSYININDTFWKDIESLEGSALTSTIDLPQIYTMSSNSINLEGEEAASFISNSYLHIESGEAFNKLIELQKSNKVEVV